jgi:hypothetical protein
VAAPPTVRLTNQAKVPPPTVKVVQPQAAPAIVVNNNPFQKAQQHQPQQALSTATQFRYQQVAPPPPPDTAHIELEEPDSAYSDSDDEETVQRRAQHKPWETREGLAKALEEQATVDADMIFGIPHGVVPIDEILPAQTDYARERRARPRSSSATWSRDGLKQIEIDRYNERMGISGPGVLLPVTVQDDGSGTPSRSHRLSAIAQSAITQGHVSKKPAASVRGSVSPLRPATGLHRTATGTTLPGSASGAKYPSLVPNQKAKVTKQGGSALVTASSQSSKHGSTKTATAKNPFQNSAGGGGTLQSARIATTGVKVPTSIDRKKS